MIITGRVTMDVPLLINSLMNGNMKNKQVKSTGAGGGKGAGPLNPAHAYNDDNNDVPPVTDHLDDKMKERTLVTAAANSLNPSSTMTFFVSTITFHPLSYQVIGLSKTAFLLHFVSFARTCIHGYGY